jgi:hypothetical protein
VLQIFVKTSTRLFQRLKDLGISGQSSSLKATGYKGYNLSMYITNGILEEKTMKNFSKEFLHFNFGKEFVD